jgi:hypothetical protein
MTTSCGASTDLISPGIRAILNDFPELSAGLTELVLQAWKHFERGAISLHASVFPGFETRMELSSFRFMYAIVDSATASWSTNWLARRVTAAVTATSYCLRHAWKNVLPWDDLLTNVETGRLGEDHQQVMVIPRATVDRILKGG